MTDQKKQAITALIEDIKSSDLDLPSIDLLQFGVMLLKAKEMTTLISLTARQVRTAQHIDNREDEI